MNLLFLFVQTQALLPSKIANAVEKKDWKMKDGYYPILSNFFEGKLYVIKVLGHVAQDVGSVCIPDKKQRWRFADAACKRLGFPGVEKVAKFSESSSFSGPGAIKCGKTRKDCDLDYYVTGAHCSADASWPECDVKTISDERGEECLQERDELYVRCNFKMNITFNGNQEITNFMKEAFQELEVVKDGLCSHGRKIKINICGLGRQPRVADNNGTWKGYPQYCHGPVIQQTCCATRNDPVIIPKFNETSQKHDFEYRPPTAPQSDSTTIDKLTSCDPNHQCNIVHWSPAEELELNSSKCSFPVNHLKKRESQKASEMLAQNVREANDLKKESITSFKRILGAFSCSNSLKLSNFCFFIIFALYSFGF